MRVLIIATMLVLMGCSHATPFEDTRYCGEPVRDAEGKIKRSSAVLSAFQRIHPCPSTGAQTGPCPGWAKNHVVPLACGGCDAVSNLQWLPVDIKACAGPHCVDRFERKIYSLDIPGTPGCVNEAVE